METVYRERANGRFEYWVYSEGRRVVVSATWAIREVCRGARLINI